MQYSLFDFLGNLGAGLIILMYLLLHLRKIKSESILYSFLNAFGAGLIIVSLFIIEIFWLLISLLGIYNWKQQHS